MPLVKRAVQPYYASRSGETADIGNPLECIVVRTISNVIRQLASLSKHAEDLFAEIFTESSSYVERTKRLENRVNGLATRVKALDASTEKVSFEDVAVYRHFKSTHPTDQKLLSRSSLPAALAECYAQCSAPPQLSKFDKFREDQRSSMTFYTDPDYFFNLWKASMEQPKKKQQRRTRVKKQASGSAAVVAPVKKKNRRIGLSAELDELESEPKTPKESHIAKASSQSSSMAGGHPGSQTPSSSSSTANSPTLAPDHTEQQKIRNIPKDSEIVYEMPDVTVNKHPLKKQPSSKSLTSTNSSAVYYSPVEGGTNDSAVHSYADTIATSDHCPPPDTEDTIRQEPVKSHLPPERSPPPPARCPPPPPPPPPPPSLGTKEMSPPPSRSAPPKPPRTGGSIRSKSISEHKEKVIPKPAVDPRANLLEAIRLGKQLRTVEATNAEQSPSNRAGQSFSGASDVASILARRIAIEASDSDYSEADDDDEDWT